MSEEKTLRLWVCRTLNGNLYISTQEPSPNDHPNRIVNWSCSTQMTAWRHCAVGDALIELLEPLSFKAGQLAEIEVREVQRWEKA